MNADNTMSALHQEWMNSVAVSAGGRVAVSGSDDNTVRVWALDWEYEFGVEDSAGAAATARLDREG